jgi:hypothetical protein
MKSKWEQHLNFPVFDEEKDPIMLVMEIQKNWMLA